jgi:cellulose synthase/poly-beta-1,6-N-acetylglucosamine synthase-like glycosyltransferase
MPKNWPNLALVGIQAAFFAYFAALILSYLLLLVLSWVWCRRYKKRAATHLIDFEALKALRALVPPLTLIVPAYNEERVIVESVRSMLGLSYARLDVVVVNDGSSDATLQRLIRHFSLRKSEVRPTGELPTRPVRDFYVSITEPRLVVIDKENGGKADALNAGINFCQSPYFLAMDADSLLEPEALTYCLRPILEDPGRVVAVGGIVRGVNGSIVDAGRVRRPQLQLNFWVIMQVIEYLRSFLAGRAGWSLINGLLIVPGAFGLFQKAACVKVGGYSTETVTEDLELIVRLHRYARERKLDWRILFAPDAVCWTEMPTTARVLGRQRKRWHEGLWQTVRIHKSMLFRPRYGVVGMCALPYQVLFEMLGPFVELSGLIVMPIWFLFDRLSARAFVSYLALAFFFGVILSLFSLLIDQMHFPRHRFPRDAILVLFFSLLENLGYRQIQMAWRVAASWNFFFGKVAWRVSTRTGFTTRAG